MVSTNSSFTAPESGRLYRRTLVLQDNIAGSLVNVVGTVWEISPNAPGDVAAINQNAAMYFYCEQDTGVGNPTTELWLVGSPDGVYWQEICAISRMLTTAEAIVEIREIDVLPRFIAVMSRVGGGGPGQRPCSPCPLSRRLPCGPDWSRSTARCTRGRTSCLRCTRSRTRVPWTPRP